MIALGTLVAYSHLAAVARRAGKDQYQQGWYIPVKGNGDVPVGVLDEGRPIFIDGQGTSLPSDKLGKYNKVVIAWEQAGSGVVTGLVTKQMGVSNASSSYTNAYGEGDFDQGYFTNYGNIELYVIRHELRGSRFVYAPTWAVTPQVLKEEIAA